MLLVRMKYVLLLAGLLQRTMGGFCQSTHMIYIPADAEIQVIESAKDMAYWLEKAGAGVFTVKTAEGEEEGGAAGIHIVFTEKSSVSAYVRKQLLADGQTFHLQANGLTNTWITGSGSNSFINGIYTFLQELGFRWYIDRKSVV